MHKTLPRNTLLRAACTFGAARPAPPATATKPASVHLAKVLTAEFLHDTTRFTSCRASTIVETENHQLVAAFFGGTAERNQFRGSSCPSSKSDT